MTTPAPVALPPTFPARRVYSVVGVPPEVQAYAMAKYSRSSQGMLESIRELSQQKAEEFLDTFYFQYGHRSIADLAHLVFGVEQVSILAAIALVDEQVWDGQERSTRYQPFRKTGWFTPDAVRGSAAESLYEEATRSLFAAYEGLTAQLQALLEDAVPRPAAMAEDVYRRTLRARAFDVSRSLLPLATHTSLGQVVSARVVERQIGRLLTSVYPEIRSIGDELKAACGRPSESPLLEELAEDPSRRDLLRPRAAPTLVKYAQASAYQQETAAELTAASDELLGPVGEPDREAPVELVELTSRDPRDEIVATLLYKHDRTGHSYRQIVAVVEGLTASEKEDLFQRSYVRRGRRDEPPREHQAGYALQFDVLMDLGSFRDLHRHRRCVQVQQPYTWAHGFLPPEEVFPMALGRQAAAAALAGGLGDRYADALVSTERAAASVREAAGPLAADYLLPLAYRNRTLFKMDWAQAAYMIEQRTAPTGHFSYRHTAWQMLEALRARYPHLAAAIRAADPHALPDLLQR